MFGKSPTKVSASSSKAPRKGTLRSVNIEIADGGVTVNCRYDMTSMQMYDGPYDREKPKVFTDIKKAMEYVEKEAAAGVAHATTKK